GEQNVRVDALVPRTRSSHDFAAGTVANFGFKSGTRIIELLVSFSIPKFARSSRRMVANFGIGTLVGRFHGSNHMPTQAEREMSLQNAGSQELGDSFRYDWFHGIGR